MTTNQFTSTTDYIEKSFILLKDHQWIYNYPNIAVLTDNIFNKIPSEWLKYLRDLTYDEIHNLGLGVLDVSFTVKKKKIFYLLFIKNRSTFLHYFLILFTDLEKFSTRLRALRIHIFIFKIGIISLTYL